MFARLAIDSLEVVPCFGVFPGGGPFAVLWTVRTISIYPMQAMFRARSRADVFKKGFKRNAPPLTDDNATPPIARIGMVTRVRAAVFHHGIHAAQRVFRKAVFIVGLSQTFTSLAAAALAAHAAKVAAIDFAHRTAIALAEPVKLMLIANGRIAYNEPSAKPFTGHICDRTHCFT